MPNVLGISGSPRKGGNSDILLKSFLEGARRGECETEGINLYEYQFQGCIGCERCRKTNRCLGLQDGMQIIYPKLLESNGLVMVSPTYNYNVTPWMKAFIDRLYCFYGYTDTRPRNWWSTLADQGRKAVFCAIGEQPDPDEAIGLTMTAMKSPLEALGYEVVAELPIIGIFDKGMVRDNPDNCRKAEEMGYELAKNLV